MSEAFATDFKDRIKQKGFAPSQIGVKTSSIVVHKTPLRVPVGYEPKANVASDNMSRVEPKQDNNTEKRIAQLVRFQRTNNLSNKKMRKMLVKLANEGETLELQNFYNHLASSWELPEAPKSKSETIEEMINNNRHIDMRPDDRLRRKLRGSGRSEFL